MHANPELRRWTRRLWMAPLSIVVLLLILAAAGFSYEKIAEARDRAQFPPPGTLVDVDGFALHLHCIGEGSPTVVLDTGLGVVSRSWAAVQDAVAPATRVCSYDRAGYAWSDPGPAPRSSASIARELFALLRNAGEQPPFVLAGHSFGGYNIRVFAHEHPDAVAGLIFVDSSHEDQVAHMPAEMRGAQEDLRVLFQLLRIASKLGVVRLFPSLIGIDESTGLSREIVAFSVSPNFIDTVIAEQSQLQASASDVRKARQFGTLPLIVLTAGIVDDDSAPGVSAEAVKRFHDVWVGELQTDLAGLSTRGRQIIVEDSGHMIPLVRPDIVSDAILEVVREVKAAR